MALKLPYVRTASEIQEMKFWRAPVRESHRIVDPVKRAKNHTSRLINMQLSKLSSITRQVSMDFSSTQAHASEVVVLTIGKGTYENYLQMLRRVYAMLHNTGKLYERECQVLRTKQEAELKKIVDDNAETLREAANMVKMLRGLPHVDLDKPIFSFVGAPNVGKSSLVRALSTASPEVANYPFTTRGITMGHIFVDGISYQIADTPGLIFRPDERRNAIEKLAIAIVEKTQASIGFVFDPSSSSGTSAVDQILLRDELRQRVMAARPEHKWIDIISKIDQPSSGLPLLKERLGSSPHFCVSAQTNECLVELGDEIRRVLTQSASEDGFLE
ncbi:hypothetical protein DD237_004554 [Peronospora effusa]|uniref:G domain-containing protein n=1 Tax=Peronospora effusa TaxID=542832 RepID=A0A425C3P6_9STRA|nr:hypothetical protein DD237_004554 [Peronospora effusa]